MLATICIFSEENFWIFEYKSFFQIKKNIFCHQICIYQSASLIIILLNDNIMQHNIHCRRLNFSGLMISLRFNNQQA